VRVADERAVDVDDLATARTLIATLQAEITKLQREKAALQHHLDILCQRLFGKKSERVSPDQLRLAFAQLANEPGAAAEPIEMDSGERPGRPRRRPAPPTGRRLLPPTLPRQRVEIDVPDTDKTCACGHTKARIGEMVSEKLAYVPASLRVIETARFKYACPRCHDGVVAAPAPPQAMKNHSRGKDCSRTSWSRSTSIICHSIGSNGSSCVKASICRARRCAGGSRMSRWR
jgi:hypothetical protein